ncbi:MAG: two-component system osmolarity sensor histidine kinase EnvZ [Planctomycetota bacterium]
MSVENRFPLRWHDRLSVRIGLFVALCISVGDYLAGPVYDLVIPLEEELAGDNSLWVKFKYFLMSTGYATILGTVLGLVAARYSIPRLRSIALQASQVSDSEIPGPFEEEGKDEIALVARALNQMRTRIMALVGRLDERDFKRNEWVAQVSHDLRTPLTALITSLEHSSVLIAKGDPDTEVLRRNNDVAQINARRVAAMAEDLLDIARLEIEDSLRTEAVLPGEIVEHTLKGLKILALEAGVELRFELESGVPTLEGDGHLILRALENLTLNSIQHSRTWVKTSVSRIGESIRFRVEDDGEGFPDCPGEVAFAELKSIRSRADSTGLGLIVVARVAQMHCGVVSGRNRAEGGAQIDLILPITGPI